MSGNVTCTRKLKKVFYLFIVQFGKFGARFEICGIFGQIG